MFRFDFEQVCSIDTETTGLYPFKCDRLFSIVIADSRGACYFNFKKYEDSGIAVCGDEEVARLKVLLADESRVWFLQNAKFDLHFLKNEGLVISGKIYDISFLDRLYNNQSFKYSLDEIAKRWGEEKKSFLISEFFKGDGLKSQKVCSESGKEYEVLHYDKLPYEVVKEYAEQDAIATYNIGQKLLKHFRDAEVGNKYKTQLAVIENESALTKTLFNMEQVGVKIDYEYCKSALEHYRNITKAKAKEFENLTGKEFVKGTLVFEEVFISEKDKWVKTDKGNWKWDSSVLERFENPAANLVIEYSEAKKQLEYFENFLFYKDAHNVIHTDFKQSGTATGRLSASSPNVQNLTNPDKYDSDTDSSVYPVRRAFVPREGFFFVMIDYKQIEYRVFLEYAKAYSLIDQIKSGVDVHQATANVSGVTRKEAKTCNFLTLYGGGVAKLVVQLFSPVGSQAQISAQYKSMMGWRLRSDEAKAMSTVTSDMISHNKPLILKAIAIQKAIFNASPEIKSTIKSIQSTAEKRGFVVNWLGRRLYITDNKFAYKIPNHLIQGSSADILKAALNELEKFLDGKLSRMVLNVHDEIVFEIHKSESGIVPELAAIMTRVFPHKLLPLEVDIEFSTKNLADKLEFNLAELYSEETGDEVQGEIFTKVTDDSAGMGFEDARKEQKWYS